MSSLHRYLRQTPHLPRPPLHPPLLLLDVLPIPFYLALRLQLRPLLLPLPWSIFSVTTPLLPP